jgi:hypothetical protein
MKTSIEAAQQMHMKTCLNGSLVGITVPVAVASEACGQGHKSILQSGDERLLGTYMFEQEECSTWLERAANFLKALYWITNGTENKRCDCTIKRTTGKGERLRGRLRYRQGNPCQWEALTHVCQHCYIGFGCFDALNFLWEVVLEIKSCTSTNLQHYSMRVLNQFPSQGFEEATLTTSQADSFIASSKERMVNAWCSWPAGIGGFTHFSDLPVPFFSFKIIINLYCL